MTGMKHHALAFLLAVTAVACSNAANRRGVIPRQAGAAPVPELVVVWVGEGKAERLEDGQWRRAETFDYEFTVENRRFADHWESVKHLKRRHPAYDGSAGPREQTMYFRVDLGQVDAGGKVPLALRTSLGAGQGVADREFREATLVLHPDISRFAPFDTYRISQRYLYEDGRLVETVSLDKGERPWVRNQESASLFAAHRFDRAPTTR